MKKICIEIPLSQFTSIEVYHINVNLNSNNYAKDIYIDDNDYIKRLSNNIFKIFKKTIINQIITYIV
jgi:hypothetical protein